MRDTERERERERDRDRKNEREREGGEREAFSNNFQYTLEWIFKFNCF